VADQERGEVLRPRLRACPPPPPLPRDPAETAPPGRSDLGAAPELQALLTGLDDLRLSLSADLGRAASAVDAGAPSVASDVLAGATDDLAAFSARHGRPLLPIPGERGTGPAADVVPAARRRRRLAVLAPALTAAAALVGLLLGVVPGPAGGPAPEQPAEAEQALRLLELRVQVLDDPQHGGALADELAESQRLVAALRRAVSGLGD
jgi:hypothetical protein